MIALRTVRVDDRELLWNLLQKYLYEMAGFYDDLTMDEKGNYQYEHFGDYFTDPKRTAYFICSGGVVAGFALLCPYSCSGFEPDHTIAEFTVFPSFRRNHIALEAAKMILAKHPGKWEIRYSGKNPGAGRLWNAVAAPYMPEVYRFGEEEIVLVFDTGRSDADGG